MKNFLVRFKNNNLKGFMLLTEKECKSLHKNNKAVLENYFNSQLERLKKDWIKISKPVNYLLSDIPKTNKTATFERELRKYKFSGETIETTFEEWSKTRTYRFEFNRGDLFVGFSSVEEWESQISKYEIDESTYQKLVSIFGKEFGLIYWYFLPGSDNSNNDEDEDDEEWA